MAATTVFQGGSISVIDYRCAMGPADEPFVELHDGFSVSYVRKGIGITCHAIYHAGQVQLLRRLHAG